MAKSKKVVIREEFKKNVGAIHTSGELSLLERKMSNILLLNAYDSLPTAKSHSIPVAHLCAMLGWEESNNVERLKDALRTLVSTRIEFNLLDKEGKEHWEVTTIISGGNIGNGICTYRYDSELAKKLYHPSVYATINIGIQRRFSGNYALTLYENCVRFRNNGPESGTGFIPIDKFRKLMGAENVAYEDYKYLKRDVIKKSVDEINKVSDIEIELVEERGKGRKVTAVKFLVKENPQLSLFEREIPENFGEMRKDETYRKLRDAGIGERLALSMILNDPKRAKEVLEYATDRASKGMIDKSLPGYIRSVYESGGELPQAAEEKKRAKVLEKRASEDAQAREERLRAAFNEHWKKIGDDFISQLPGEELESSYAQWAAGPGKLLSQKGKKGVDNQGFRAHLRVQLQGKPTEQDFQTWAKNQS